MAVPTNFLQINKLQEICHGIKKIMNFDAIATEDLVYTTTKGEVVDLKQGEKFTFDLAELINTKESADVLDKFDCTDFLAKNLTEFTCNALWEYQAEESNELTINPQNEIRILKTADRDWWYGYNKIDEKAEGFIPANFLDFKSLKDPKWSPALKPSKPSRPSAAAPSLPITVTAQETATSTVAPIPIIDATLVTEVIKEMTDHSETNSKLRFAPKPLITINPDLIKKIRKVASKMKDTKTIDENFKSKVEEFISNEIKNNMVKEITYVNSHKILDEGKLSEKIATSFEKFAEKLLDYNNQFKNIRSDLGLTDDLSAKIDDSFNTVIGRINAQIGPDLKDSVDSEIAGIIDNCKSKALACSSQPTTVAETEVTAPSAAADIPALDVATSSHAVALETLNDETKSSEEPKINRDEIGLQPGDDLRLHKLLTKLDCKKTVDNQPFVEDPTKIYLDVDLVYQIDNRIKELRAGKGTYPYNEEQIKVIEEMLLDEITNFYKKQPDVKIHELSTKLINENDIETYCNNFRNFIAPYLTYRNNLTKRYNYPDFNEKLNNKILEVAKLFLNKIHASFSSTTDDCGREQINAALDVCKEELKLQQTPVVAAASRP